MDLTQQLLQISAKLYQQLTEIPKEDQRDDLIKKINEMLDQRGIIITNLQQQGFQVDRTQKSHMMLIELDKGIRERLDNVMKSIQVDLKNLQNAKKNEQQYMNPYANVQVMDGRYYDKKN